MRLPRFFLVAVMATLLSSTANAQTPIRDRPVSFGMGAGIGPGYLGYGNTTGWWTRAFGTARFRLSSSWSVLLEAGLEYGRSSVDGQYSGDNLLPDEGGVSIGTAHAPLSQEFRATAFLVHGLIGYDFGSVFGLRVGPLVGYASGTMRTDNCGNAAHTGIPAGGALAPTFYLWRGLELRTQAEVAFMPLPVCTQAARAGSEWVAWEAPKVGQSEQPVMSVILTLAYIGF